MIDFDLSAEPESHDQAQERVWTENATLAVDNPIYQIGSRAWLENAVRAILILSSRRMIVAHAETVTERLLNYSRKLSSDHRTGQAMAFLLDEEDSQEHDFLTGLDWEKQSLMDVLKAEKELLGFYATIHPVDLVFACGLLGLSAYSQEADIRLLKPEVRKK